MSGWNLRARNKTASHGYIRIQEQNRSSRCCKALPLSPTVKSSPDHDASVGKDGSKFTQGGMDLLHMVLLLMLHSTAIIAISSITPDHYTDPSSRTSEMGLVLHSVRESDGESKGGRHPPPPRTSSRGFFGDPAGPGGEMWWRQR